MEKQVIVTIRVPASLRRKFRRKLDSESRKASPLIEGWIEAWLATGSPEKVRT